MGDQEGESLIEYWSDIVEEHHAMNPEGAENDDFRNIRTALSGKEQEKEDTIDFLMKNLSLG